MSEKSNQIHEELKNNHRYNYLIDKLSRYRSNHNRYIGSGRTWDTFYYQLWDVINIHGIKALREYLHDFDCVMPRLHHCKATEKWYIARRCIDLMLNDQVILADNYAPDFRFDYISYHTPHSIYYYTPSFEGSFYNGTPLSYIITYGDICEYHPDHFTLHGNPCPVCAEENNAMPYSTAVEQILGFEETKERLYGVELEYEGVFARDVNMNLKGFAVAKNDGSISNGVELVTRPACMATQKQMLKKFYDAVRTQAASNTGMHVHVDKKRLSQFQIGVIIEFMNNEDNYPFIEQIAGRDFKNNHYCKQNSKLKAWHGIQYDYDQYKYFRTSNNRYEAINLQKHATIEFRIFSSPESWEEFCAKLSFVDALVDFCNPYITNLSYKNRISWINFKNYVLANLKKYHDLVHYNKGVFA